MVLTVPNMTRLLYKLVKAGFFVGLLIIGVLFYLYKKLNDGPSCFVADQPYKLSSKVVNNRSYAIYVVIAGFHEKSQVFYLNS